MTKSNGIPLLVGENGKNVLLLNRYSTPSYKQFIVHKGTDPSWDSYVSVPSALPDWGAEDGYTVIITQCPSEDKIQAELEPAPNGCPVCKCSAPQTWPFSGCDVTCGARCDQQGCCCISGVGICPGPANHTKAVVV